MHQTGIVPFPCHVSHKTCKLSFAYVHFPALVATSVVAVLQAPDGVYPKAHAVQRNLLQGLGSSRIS